MCDNHHPVPCRELEFHMVPAFYPPGVIIRAKVGRTADTFAIVGHTDGLGCPACGSFEPNEKPHA